jgi:hypothetical protein
MKRITWLPFVSMVIPMVCLPLAAHASVFGTLGNFDVINDTGVTAHGFEIELEGLHISDITDTFGGLNRGFPSGTGFDPSTAVVRYGAPSISEYSIGSVPVTRITYAATFTPGASGAPGSWDFGTPSGTFITPGDNCWTGGGVGYGADTPCDHFGVGTIGNASKTTYSWLLDPTNSGVLTGANGVVNLPAPVWNVIPAAPAPVGQAQAQPVVFAVIKAPDPVAGLDFGDAIWVKVFTTELPDAIKLEDLIGGNPKVDQAETETEWALLQVERGNAGSGYLESGLGLPAGPNAASILRRYEFYKFSGLYKSDHEATFADGYGDSKPYIEFDINGNIVGGDVGTYLGAQNGAVNLAALAPVPEPETYAMMLAGLGMVFGIARRRRRAR